MRIKLTIFFILFFCASYAQHYDWPMWRFDHERSASSPENLAENLYLQWQIHFTPRVPVWDDPLNQNLMQFDQIFEPIIADGKLFIGFNDQDKVLALDLNSGQEVWRFYTDGPVRLPLAANKGKIYFTSDDGNCYCLDGNTGKLIWKRSLAPGPNQLIGNRRMISMWPARGGIVIKDDIIYTASSIFPMMGTYIYALNTMNGEIIWKNEGTGSNYILQPHNSPAFADVAPQGTFTISGDKLLVAGGRSVPAAFDLETGEKLYYKLAESGKTGGAFTFANDKIFFNHHRERMTFMYDSNTGNRIKSNAGEYPVVDDNRIYFSGSKLSASYLNSKNELKTLWQYYVTADKDLIKAGDCLYAADSKGVITAVNVRDDQPGILWTINTGMNIERLLAGNGKLIAITGDGTILVYGENRVNNVITHKQTSSGLTYTSGLATNIIKNTGIKQGYATIYGTGSLDLLKALVAVTELNMIVLEKDSLKIDANRRYFDDLGVTAERISFLRHDQVGKSLPKYYSSLTIINDLSYLNNFSKETIQQIYESVRPYNGKIWCNVKGNDQKKLTRTIEEMNLYGAEVSSQRGYTLMTRAGALEGSADWTHNNGNIANTVKSDDKRVKAPLGILWFGGNSNLDVLPRHGHGPPQQILDGYLVIQGINSITARDVYTGRTIWQKVFENLKEDTWMVYYDETYDEDNPLDPKYNQVHIPGANARGTNYIVTKEYVYVIEGNRCHLLDLRTGEEVKMFTSGKEDTERFAYIGVYQDYLILGNNFAEYEEVPLREDETPKAKFEDFNLTASSGLMVLNRFTGEKFWSIKANHGFIHNSIIAGDGMLFCLDKLPQLQETRLKRRGQNIPEGTRLLYLDIHSGKEIHKETENVFGTWLGYSSEHKLLLQATRPSKDMLNGEDGRRMIIYKTDTKEVLWDKEIRYANPPIISNDKIYTSEEGFSLFTGDPILEKDPLTGEDIRWSYKREYGCGYVVASEHLLTFRSASAAFVNLNSFEGTASLGGWKSGCTPNLIVANGVLNSPDYTRTCQCAYQNQTSLALIHMPWMNYWTNSNYVWNGKQIRTLGLNLNAPGDRTSSSNILWIDFPNVGGTSPEIPVNIEAKEIYSLRKEPISIKSEDTPWVSASAIGGIRLIEIPLSKDEVTGDHSYRVNLYFAELENKMAGERVFNVNIQGKQVFSDVDIFKETGETDKELIKSVSGIKAGNKLKIELIPVTGNTILSGIELIMEN